MSCRIRLLESEEGLSVSCLDLPGCPSQGVSREEALEGGVPSVQTVKLGLQLLRLLAISQMEVVGFLEAGLSNRSPVRASDTEKSEY